MVESPDIIKLGKIFPNRKLFFPVTDIPSLFETEKSTMVFGRKHEIAKKVYSRLLDDLKIYSDKTSGTTAKHYVDSVLSRNIILIGRLSNQKNSLVGSFIENKGKLAAIILDANELEIDTFDGSTSNIDKCFYTTYFQFIRASVVINQDRIVKDSALHKLACEYLNLLYLKFLGNNVHLNDKQKIYLQFLVAYFYFRFMLGKKHEEAREFSTQGFDKQIRTEVDFLIKRLSKYQHNKDIFSAFVDFNIINDNPSTLIMKALSKYKIFPFYAFSSTLDYLIALIIVSKYPADFCTTAFINNNISNQIEKEMEKYFKSIKYDITAMSHI